MPIAAVNGTNLYYHESGQGLPVVLLHGFPLDHRIWHKQVHDLSPVCRVITPDLRGFGQSTGGGELHHASRWPRIYISCSRRFTRCPACWAGSPWAGTLRWRMNATMPPLFAD